MGRLMSDRPIAELIVEAYGCEADLDDGPALAAALRGAAESVGAVVLRESAHAYCPHGVTAMVFLAESHALLTTWPEHGYAIAEIFLCNPQMDPHRVWSDLERFLRPAEIRVHEVPIEIARRPRKASRA
jgi:S-adenosylmethionine decarboxylase